MVNVTSFFKKLIKSYKRSGKIQKSSVKILLQEWKKVKEEIAKKSGKGAGRITRWSKEGIVLRCNKKL